MQTVQKLTARTNSSTRPTRRLQTVAALPRPATTAAAALLLSATLLATPTMAIASQFTEKIATDEALVQSRIDKLDYALAQRLGKTKAEAVGKRQVVEREAASIESAIGKKLNSDLAELDQAKAAEARKKELQKEISSLVNTEAAVQRKLSDVETAIDREERVKAAKVISDKQRVERAATEVKQRLEKDASRDSAAAAADADEMTRSINNWIASISRE